MCWLVLNQYNLKFHFSNHRIVLLQRYLDQQNLAGNIYMLRLANYKVIMQGNYSFRNQINCFSLGYYCVSKTYEPSSCNTKWIFNNPSSSRKSIIKFWPSIQYFFFRWPINYIVINVVPWFIVFVNSSIIMTTCVTNVNYCEFILFVTSSK